ncbi:hypothetical protein EV182_000046 [Spiromyces aspiralis]|uniref:Uncharacterized protein n=1 Tax=Spiromyces aspiralis TaxID=68401 RepID=A0ACC1HJU0_9FUNG|nr:hypothetical protein EV182_000046 [Spiromyces aspiralis]
MTEREARPADAEPHASGHVVLVKNGDGRPQSSITYPQQPLPPLSSQLPVSASYEEKYRKLKRKLRDVLDENVRITAKMQEKDKRIARLYREKELLLDRIEQLLANQSQSIEDDDDNDEYHISKEYDYEDDADMASDLSSSLGSDLGSEINSEMSIEYQRGMPVGSTHKGRTIAESSSATSGKRGTRGHNARLPALAYGISTPSRNASADMLGALPSASGRRSSRARYSPTTPAKRSHASANLNDSDLESASANTPGIDADSHQSMMLDDINDDPSQQRPRKMSRKKRRQLEISSRVRSVQPVPRDEEGNYILPIQVGILTVLNLGHVVWDRDTFHNERYIWPVGYTVQREYGSMIDPDKNVIYTCRISDGGDGPRFHIEPEDMPDSPIIANSATGAWTHAVRVVNQIRKREHSNSASGPDYFGFSHPTIAKMIQDLPGVEKCKNYVFQKFVEMKERHVRGVMKKGRGGKPQPAMLDRGRKALEAQKDRPENATILQGFLSSPSARDGDSSAAALAAQRSSLSSSASTADVVAAMTAEGSPDDVGSVDDTVDGFALGDKDAEEDEESDTAEGRQHVGVSGNNGGGATAATTEGAET